MYINTYMEPVYGKKISFGKIFQYDENIVTKSKSEATKDVKPKQIIENKKTELKSELDKEIDNNPFFFF